MGFEPLEGIRQLREAGFELAFALRREDRDVGVMLVDAPPDSLTRDVRAVLEILAGQVAIAIEDCRLVAENVQLERRLAQRERLAALGQMAATVAHEIRNPLSAIKSIVQVMREDERLHGDYSRDLDLIVGETDRLSRSVTQMLSFARNAPHADTPRRLSEIVSSVIYLLQSETNARGARIRDDSAAVEAELDGATAGVVRDAISNLLINALQATPRGGVISIEASRVDDTRARLTVTDEGPGVPDELRERIWEPFFTTRQRGTGLGLAIVRKRIEEIGGSATLAPKRNGEGARFELDIPLRRL
jgi:signal transduction histidine kinase